MEYDEMNEWLVTHDETMRGEHFWINKYGESPDLVFLNDKEVEAIITNKVW